MAKIQNEAEYTAIMKRIEELLPYTWGDNVSENDPKVIELNLLSDLIADYEDEHVHLRKPTLDEIIRLRLSERNISLTAAAEMLELSLSSMDELMKGASEPSYRTCQNLCTKFNIAPSVVLGL